MVVRCLVHLCVQRVVPCFDRANPNHPPTPDLHPPCPPNPRQQEVVLPSGVRYVDERIGGGQSPSKGLLVVLSYTATADGAVFDDTRARNKPIVFLYGSRPFTGGLCAGVEEALATMKAGGRRRVTVPAARGFGERGAVMRPTEHVPDKQGLVPPNATLEYDLELLRVSIPPS